MEVERIGLQEKVSQFEQDIASLSNENRLLKGEFN